jgi:GNAT superfamily N-acetyltransferase
MNAQLKPQPEFRRELACEALAREIAPLLEAHYREIAHYPDPLRVDYARYLRAEAMGQLRLFTIRVEGALVGYADFTLDKSPKYGILQASQGDLFLLPEYRRGRVGIRFIRWCDEALKTERVMVVYQHTKIAHPAMGKVLEHLGYEPIDIIWGKRL